MKYNGKDKFAELNSKYIIENYNIERSNPEKHYVEIKINNKDNGEEVASIIGYLYDYNAEGTFGKKNDAFHIKALGTNEPYLKKGIATYLMKEAIGYAESKKVKHITVNPVATASIIKQKDLETFYRKFAFNYKCMGFNRERGIEFKVIVD